MIQVGFQRIIENVYRNSGYEDIDWEAAVEWTAALMRVIGVPSAFTNKSTNGLNGNPYPIEISNYRGKLPTDMVIRGSCRRIDINDNMEIYKFSAMQETTDLFFQTPPPNSSSINDPVFFDPTFNTFYIDENGDSQPLVLTQSPFYSNSGELFSYKIDNNIIFTDFKDGYVEINPASPGMKALVNHSSQERDWAVASARTKGRIPTIDELESIKKMWIRSIPKINEHATGFKTLGSPEIRYNNN